MSVYVSCSLASITRSRCFKLLVTRKTLLTKRFRAESKLWPNNFCLSPNSENAVVKLLDAGKLSAVTKLSLTLSFFQRQQQKQQMENEVMSGWISDKARPLSPIKTWLRGGMLRTKDIMIISSAIISWLRAASWPLARCVYAGRSLLSGARRIRGVLQGNVGQHRAT